MLSITIWIQFTSAGRPSYRAGVGYLLIGQAGLYQIFYVTLVLTRNTDPDRTGQYVTSRGICSSAIFCGRYSAVICVISSMLTPCSMVHNPGACVTHVQGADVGRNGSYRPLAVRYQTNICGRSYLDNII